MCAKPPDLSETQVNINLNAVQCYIFRPSFLDRINCC